MSHLMLLTKTSETPLTETLESATEMLQTSVSGAQRAELEGFLGYYDFTDIFNTAQCDCSYTSSDQNLETAAGIA